MTATVLLLGGTGEARALAAELAPRRGLRLVSSLAGRVRDPALPAGEVRVGGFGGAAGLAGWLREHGAGAVVDATHPFAATISAHAATACDTCGVPRVVLRRTPWPPDPAWHRVAAIAHAPAAITSLVPRDACVFLTTGRRDLAVFAGDREHRYLVRTVDPPEGAVPPRHHILLDRGPFTVAGERALLRSHDVSLLVTKDSGGALTVAKLAAARELDVPVLVVDRPPVPAGSPCVPDVAGALAWLAALPGAVGQAVGTAADTGAG